VSYKIFVGDLYVRSIDHITFKTFKTEVFI